MFFLYLRVSQTIDKIQKKKAKRKPFLFFFAIPTQP